jgi:hypothetical protein
MVVGDQHPDGRGRVGHRDTSKKAKGRKERLGTEASMRLHLVGRLPTR